MCKEKELESFKEKACFGDTDSVRTTINKIRRLRQGDRPASAYAADFRLLATDIPWDDQALMEQFRYGLRNDVKDLLLTFPEEPKSTRKQSVERYNATTAFSNDIRNVSSRCQGQDQSPPMPQ